MSDDLVRRIWRCDITGNPVGTDTRLISAAPCQCQGCEAATALTEARAEIERLRWDKSAGFAFWRSIAKRFCDARKAALDRALAAESELSTLRARVREVVGPFAEIAKELSPSYCDTDKNVMHWAVPNVGAFRAARQLMENLKDA